MTKIKSIELVNIKGVENQKFDVDIRPNLPAIFIAPNGTGKSSMSIGFKSINRNRIKLDDDHHFNNDLANLPIIRIFTDDPLRPMLEATSTENSISTHFDIAVINSLIKPKVTKRFFGGASRPSADIIVEAITLIDKIPNNKKFPYSVTDAKQKFAKIGKAIPNLKAIPVIDAILAGMIENDVLAEIAKTSNQRVSSAIDAFITRINDWIGNQSSDQILTKIEQDEVAALKGINHFNSILSYIEKFQLDSSPNKNAYNCLVALQFCLCYRNDTKPLKEACQRCAYEINKNRLIQLFRDFNTTSEKFVPVEKSGSLILPFPDIGNISSGQRDVMCFIAMLQVVQQNIGKKDLILIIDEVFDYLDESNLVAAQYYISEFISENSGKINLYPILMTHLDPDLFLGHVFGKKLKVQKCYLKKYPQTVGESMKKMLRERNDNASPLKSVIEKKLIHYHSDDINERSEFERLNLKPTWAEPGIFYKFLNSEKAKYLADDPNYDPAAVCSAVRVGIEKAVYNAIECATQKYKFLEEMNSGTLCKLEYAESCGFPIPESYYLLSLIYNEGLHWKEYEAFVPRMVSKLENKTIKNMIRSVPNI